MNLLRRAWRRAAAQPWSDSRGVVSLEMGLAGSVLVLATIGIIGSALVGWTRSGLQSAAAATARCVALGAPACSDAKAYAVSKAAAWVFPGVITTGDVTVASASSCNGASGAYTRVTITSSHWVTASIPVPHSTTTLSVTACHLSATS